jgi:hypothetical protein
MRLGFVLLIAVTLGGCNPTWQVWLDVRTTHGEPVPSSLRVLCPEGPRSELGYAREDIGVRHSGAGFIPPSCTLEVKPAKRVSRVIPIEQACTVRRGRHDECAEARVSIVVE